jgi:hypothetical protein
MQTHQVNVQRCSIISRKPFDAVLAAVEEAIGRPKHGRIHGKGRRRNDVRGNAERY